MERIQPLEFDYVVRVEDFKRRIPGTEAVDMMNPNKIIGYKTPVIGAFMTGKTELDTIPSLRFGGAFMGQDVRDGNAYKVQIKLNEVIAKLNEVSEKNQILE